MDPIPVDVVSDVVCPWCYIGKRQLEGAVESWSQRHPDLPIEVRWHAFQLAPDIPVEGTDRADYLLKKFGTADVGQLYARVVAAATSVGLSIDIERIARQPNTLRAHALIAATPAGEPQQAMVEELFRGFFVAGADLSSRDALLDLAERAGMARDAAAATIDDPATLERLARAEGELRAQGVNGVPLFIVDRRIDIRGAQGADAIVSALGRAMAARREPGERS